jgi:hypothetical protein
MSERIHAPAGALSHAITASNRAFTPVNGLMLERKTGLRGVGGQRVDNAVDDFLDQ